MIYEEFIDKNHFKKEGEEYSNLSRVDALIACKIAGLEKAIDVLNQLYDVIAYDSDKERIIDLTSELKYELSELKREHGL